MSLTKQVLFGITLICVSGHFEGDCWSQYCAATQYCDGLRGPMVVYDPFDPHMLRYDIDDGEHRSQCNGYLQTVEP